MFKLKYLKQFAKNDLIYKSLKVFSSSSCKFTKQIVSEASESLPYNIKHESFTKRHIGPNETETQEMLKYLGVNSLDEFIAQTVPKHIMLNGDEQKRFDSLKGSLSEKTGLEYIETIANQNKLFTNYIGSGYHPTFVPPVVLRNLTENPAWYTSYTPYQSEISQGRLESLLNFQTLISELTGLPFSNASLLDEATSAAEAMYIAINKHNGKRKKFFLANDCFSHIKELIYTRAKYLHIEVVEGSTEDLKKLNDDSFSGVLIQNPSNTGKISDHTDLVSHLKNNGIVSIVAADPLSLMLVKSPAEMGFDICVGSAQRFGVPMMNGGPHAGFMAVTDELKRKMPGRVIGISKDSSGNKAYRLTLQTREQHIKREKATSNICTAQALLANMAVFYAIYNGKEGLTRVAYRVNTFANILHESLASIGYTVINKKDEIFDTVIIKASNTKEILDRFYENKINLRQIDSSHIGISFNDTTTIEDVEILLKIFEDLIKSKTKEINKHSNSYKTLIRTDLQRSNDFLNQDVFNKFSSETQIMRYLMYLQSKDYSLVHGMIPLGSCTLKLNSAAELIPITWPKFANIHPFCPENQREGYAKLINETITMLAAITQMDDVSLQPNSGANGEYAGILAIRRYQESNGQGHRNLVFIPSSAHGTNPATAAMCGLKPVVILSDKNGNIDVEDFKKKIELHKDNLSCAMITYPSTHGVFEESIKELCDLVHKSGGQVYIDGANMNAQVGITAPGVLGGDVCHLNLHKTFAIPHGGGGPGIGPICVKKHLSPFLPGHIEFKGNIFIY